MSAESTEFRINIAWQYSIIVAFGAAAVSASRDNVCVTTACNSIPISLASSNLRRLPTNVWYNAVRMRITHKKVVMKSGKHDPR
jgi:hypothetical protein